MAPQQRFGGRSRTVAPLVSDGQTRFAECLRNARHYALKISQRRAYRDASVRKNKSADRAFVLAAPLLKHGDSLAQLAGCFEVAKEENSIGKIADIDRRIHPGADQSVLRERKYRIQTLLVQVGQELMQLESQKTFPGHGIEK